MKRASEVPPVVESSGVQAGHGLDRAVTRSLSGPGGVTNDTPEHSVRSS